MTEILEALKQSNYFLKQYASTLSQADSFIVLKQYAENNKLIAGLQPERTPEQQEDLRILSGMEEAAPFIVPQEQQETPFKEILLQYDIVNEYQIRADSKEIKSLQSAARGLSEAQIRSVLERAEAYREKAKNYKAYLVICLKKEARKGSEND